MIFITLILTFLSFFQISSVAVPWVLLVLVSRSFLVDDRKNWYLAFIFGLLLSLLLGLPLGSLSLIYLAVIALIRLFKHIQPTSHWLMILPLTWVILLVEETIKSWWTHSSLDLVALTIQALLILPIHLGVLFWEERFTAKGDLRLKVKT